MHEEVQRPGNISILSATQTYGHGSRDIAQGVVLTESKASDHEISAELSVHAEGQHVQDTQEDHYLFNFG